VTVYVLIPLVKLWKLKHSKLVMQVAFGLKIYYPYCGFPNQHFDFQPPKATC
jgi:hypothetical protein